jgi:hypothetical protein
MDQSQKAAEPLKPVPTATLVRVLNSPEADPGSAQDSPEAQDNRQRASNEISMIFELKDSRAFQWFMREFIESAYQQAFDELRNPALRQKDVKLEDVQTRYVALRQVRVGMVEREIAHREQLDPNDEEIKRLREKLASL